MTSRERIKAAIRFERPDRLPCHESPWEQTLAAWKEQGLPVGIDLADHFGFDLCFMYLDVSPRFEQKVLIRELGNITYEDRFGYTVTKPEGVSSTMDFVCHKTLDIDAWEAIKPRFVLSSNPAEPARIDDRSYFGHFAPFPTWDQAVTKYRKLYSTDRYMLFSFYGPWEATWRHRGFEALLLDTIVTPDWVRDMAETYQDLVIDVLKRCLELGMRPDGVFVPDDLGYTNSLFISPTSWREIFKPTILRLGDFLAQSGIDFWLHSDGAVHPLIDDFIDCGVRVLNPLEVKAGMDVVALRQQYGQRLAFFGNIDAMKMSGPRESLEQELHRKVPLATDGGYIFHSDHSCPPEVDLDRYDWLLRTAHRIFKEFTI